MRPWGKEEQMVQLKVEGVSKSFDGEPVIQDISIELNKGELVSLLGISGGGKTTLFNIIAGLSTPDKGRVLMEGEDITGCPGRVSYMLQKDLLFPFRTIEDRQEAGGYFAQFGLEGTQKKYPAQLSGGMRQRAALLRTYLFSGSVALLDEPFSALDMLTKQSVHSWYLNVLEQIRLSTLFITHDIDEAVLLSDRIYLLTGKPGRITGEIVVREPKPRSGDFHVTEAFLEYKKCILNHLKEHSEAAL